MASVSRLLSRRMLAVLGLVGCAAAGGLGDAFSALAVEKTVSFELGGVPSATLLHGWNSTTESYPLRGPGRGPTGAHKLGHPPECAVGGRSTAGQRV